MLKLILFFIVNFGALYLGSLFMPNPSTDIWYQSLNKAPWTPPGWVFGFAWFTVMFCFSLFMYYTYLSKYLNNKLISLFIIQWLLNVLWNPLFFMFHLVLLAFIILVILLVVVIAMSFYSPKKLGYKKLFIAPYILWLFIAGSLNLYVILKN